MKTRRYATSRQKACLRCSAAKAKCDRKAGACDRCFQRGQHCIYPQNSSSQDSTQDVSSIDGADLHSSPGLQESPSTCADLSLNQPQFTPNSTNADFGFEAVYDRSASILSSPAVYGTTRNSRSDVVGRSPGDFATLDFTNLELICPIIADDISNRWLNTYLPIPGQKVKSYPTNVTAYIYKVLKSYANSTVNGRGLPPFVHASQSTISSKRTPLTVCSTLARICQGPLTNTQDVAFEVLQREMSNLYGQHGTCDDMTMLETFQAYLIYSMILFFKIQQTSAPFLRQAMTNLQHIACLSSKQGLMCVAEQQNNRPRWEAWIVSEAKRRSLFVMYLFDSLLSAQEGLPTFLGTELQGLFAPSSRVLWRADTRRSWDVAYNNHLADWPESYLCIEELWPIPPEFDEHAILGRQERVDRWLENIDEFGTMLYAVTCCTHGS